MKLTSNAFKNGEFIPAEYTCDGYNISPKLEINDAPTDTKSFAILLEDPDSRFGTFTHWIIYNIPASVKILDSNIPNNEKLADNTLQGINDFKQVGYGGPCPQIGTHRYIFKLFALNAMLSTNQPVSTENVHKLFEKHILDTTTLTGLYCLNKNK